MRSFHISVKRLLQRNHSALNPARRLLMLGNVACIALVVTPFVGCSSSATDSGEPLPAMIVPKVGSVFVFKQYTYVSSFPAFVDSVIVTDSVIESGVRLGLHTNVIHVLRSDPSAQPSQADLFYNFEPDGDLVQQFGSLAFPDQAAWMLYPVATHRSWNGKIFDSTVDDVGIRFHIVAYDTSTFDGFGTSSVNGRTLRTANMTLLMGENVLQLDSGMLTQNVHVKRTVKFAPAIGYFTEDTQTQDDGTQGPNASVVDLVLWRYELK